MAGEGPAEEKWTLRDYSLTQGAVMLKAKPDCLIKGWSIHSFSQIPINNPLTITNCYLTPTRSCWDQAPEEVFAIDSTPLLSFPGPYFRVHGCLWRTHLVPGTWWPRLGRIFSMRYLYSMDGHRHQERKGNSPFQTFQNGYVGNKMGWYDRRWWGLGGDSAYWVVGHGLSGEVSFESQLEWCTTVRYVKNMGENVPERQGMPRQWRVKGGLWGWVVMSWEKDGAI